MNQTCTYTQLGIHTKVSCQEVAEWTKAVKKYKYCPNCGKEIKRVIKYEFK